MKAQIIGMPWFEENDYPELLKIFEDSDKLHRTHGEWLTAAEKVRKRFEGQGTRVVRAHIYPKEFAEWCGAERLKLNAEARNHFASTVAYREATGGSH